MPLSKIRYVMAAVVETGIDCIFTTVPKAVFGSAKTKTSVLLVLVLYKIYSPQLFTFSVNIKEGTLKSPSLQAFRVNAKKSIKSFFISNNFNAKIIVLGKLTLIETNYFNYFCF